MSRRPSFLDNGGAPFTPEANPGFRQEVCDLLNTPAEDLDPILLRLTLVVFAQHLAESLPPELGMDAKALFSTLWSRLGAPSDQPASDPAPAEQPDETPASPTDAAPDAPLTPPDTLPDGQAANRPDSAAIAASQTPSAIAIPQPGFHPGRPLRHGRRRVSGPCRPRPGRGARNAQRCLPSPRRPYYACAGPP